MATEQHTSLEIRGMSCTHCVRAVADALADVDGLTVEDVAVGRADVHYDPDRVSRDAIREAVEEAGFELAGTEAA